MKMILHTSYRIKVLVLALLGLLLCSDALWAVAKVEIEQLESDMMRYFSTKDRASFIRVTNELRAACKDAGDERMYYIAWGKLGVYEATQQNFRQAFDITKEIKYNAQENGSIYGEYIAMHTEATILLYQQNIEAAEQAFLNAVEFHHRHFPNESAGEDLLELMKIADDRKDLKTCARYARQILDEPNVTPMHKGRALYWLSQMAFNLDDTAGFNQFYHEMELLKETEGLSTLKPVIEVNHCILNGEYEKALQLADELEEENKAECKALIYHRMGDDANAYKYMQQYKHISDSITAASRDNTLSDFYAKMNDDRMQLEQNRLEHENNVLRNRLYAAMGAVVLLILLFFIWRGHKMAKALRNDNKMLIYERKDAERALTDLNELSFFESQTELVLNTPVKLNPVCSRLCDATQAHSYKGVTVMFQTAFDDDFEIKSNPDALKKLVAHLLHYSARFTHEGYIKLICADAGDSVLFSVTDTSAGLGNKPANNIIGMFSEQGNKIRYVGMNFNICQSITRLLCGRIWHDAEYTEGTRFYFELPKDPEPLLNIYKNRKGE